MMFLNINLGPSVIQLDPNIDVPSKAPAEQDFRKKRQPKESPKKVASDKATKALLGLRSKYFFLKVFFYFFRRDKGIAKIFLKIFRKFLLPGHAHFPES